MTYFNTTKETGPQLAIYRDRARTQEERIRDWFALALEHYTPSEILAHVFPDERIPLTSVRRAVSVLTEKGYLVKTEKKRAGAYGRREYCWRRRQAPRQLNLLGDHDASNDS